MNKNIETFIGCNSEYNDAKIVMFGAPFDSTTSFRPGARFGSSAIRHESFGIETYSPYQDKDLEDTNIFDCGDLELCFGSAEKALEDIELKTKEIINDKKIPFLIGGEHLVTLGAVKAVFDQYPDVHIIHFDAHADLRDNYLGAKLSHACVMRRCCELIGDNKLTVYVHQNCLALTKAVAGLHPDLIQRGQIRVIHALGNMVVEPLGPFKALAFGNAVLHWVTVQREQQAVARVGDHLGLSGRVAFQALEGIDLLLHVVVHLKAPAPHRAQSDRCDTDPDPPGAAPSTRRDN